MNKKSEKTKYCSIYVLQKQDTMKSKHYFILFFPIQF